MDFAGGAVVHINAGVAAIVAAVVLGNRKGFPDKPMAPHNMTLTVAGASMLWVGWFGFNTGSALASNNSAGMAMAVTHISAAAGSLAWMTCEWIRFGKPRRLSENSKNGYFVKINTLFINGLKIKFCEKTSSRTAS